MHVYQPNGTMPDFGQGADMHRSVETLKIKADETQQHNFALPICYTYQFRVYSSYQRWKLQIHYIHIFVFIIIVITIHISADSKTMTMNNAMIENIIGIFRHLLIPKESTNFVNTSVLWQNHFEENSVFFNSWIHFGVIQRSLLVMLHTSGNDPNINCVRCHMRAYLNMTTTTRYATDGGFREWMNPSRTIDSVMLWKICFKYLHGSILPSNTDFSVLWPPKLCYTHTVFARTHQNVNNPSFFRRGWSGVHYQTHFAELWRKWEINTKREMIQFAQRE